MATVSWSLAPSSVTFTVWVPSESLRITGPGTANREDAPRKAISPNATRILLNCNFITILREIGLVRSIHSRDSRSVASTNRTAHGSGRGHLEVHIRDQQVNGGLTRAAFHYQGRHAAAIL